MLIEEINQVVRNADLMDSIFVKFVFIFVEIWMRASRFEKPIVDCELSIVVLVSRY